MNDALARWSAIAIAVFLVTFIAVVFSVGLIIDAWRKRRRSK